MALRVITVTFHKWTLESILARWDYEAVRGRSKLIAQLACQRPTLRRSATEFSWWDGWVATRPTQEPDEIIVIHVGDSFEVIHAIFFSIVFALALDHLCHVVIVDVVSSWWILLFWGSLAWATAIACGLVVDLDSGCLLPGLIFLPVFIADLKYLWNRSGNAEIVIDIVVYRLKSIGVRCAAFFKPGSIAWVLYIVRKVFEYSSKLLVFIRIHQAHIFVFSISQNVHKFQEACVANQWEFVKRPCLIYLSKVVI